MKKKRIAIVILGLLLLIAAIVAWKYYEMRHLRFVENMGAGINIGNSLDSTRLEEYEEGASVKDYEVSWGNPEISEELFQAIRDAGFSTVRIPVTWDEHIDEDGNISEDWISRVREVVDMALAQDLYVILDTHHEEWLDLQVEKEDEIIENFRKIWLQIANRFRFYDEKLLFEGMNEPRLRDSEDEWTAGTEEMQALVNRLNEVFIETVRSTGEGNEDRYLLICPYANRYEYDALKALEVPKGNIIVSIHFYSPHDFCQEEDGTAEWSRQDTESVEKIENTFGDMNSLFVQKGVPVIITEFACRDKDNIENRMEWLQLYMEQAEENDIGYIWWDNGSDYRLLDRETCEVVYPELVEELVK